MSDKGARLILGEIPLSEEDVKIRFITPALERAGWFKERMRTEVSLTDGRVLLSGNKPGRGAKKRADYLKRACELILKHRSPDTPCGYVRNIGREGQEAHVMTLRELQDAQVDMFTTVFVGNSQTRRIGDKLVTPRGYKNV